MSAYSPARSPASSPAKSAVNPFGSGGGGPAFGDNLATSGNDFNSASWTKTSCTINNDAITAPDGSSLADVIRPSTTAASLKRCTQNITVESGVEYQEEIYFKPYSPYLNPAFRNTGTESVAFLTATLAVSIVSTIPYYQSATIEDVGDGWFYCVARLITTSTTHAAWVGPQTSNTTVGSTSTDMLGLWGYQLRKVL